MDINSKIDEADIIYALSNTLNYFLSDFIDI